MCAIAVYVRIRARINFDTDSGIRLLSARLFSPHILRPHGSQPGYSHLRYSSAHRHNLGIVFAHHSVRNLRAPPCLTLNRDERFVGRPHRRRWRECVGVSKRIVLCFDGEWDRPPDPGVWPSAVTAATTPRRSGPERPSHRETNVYHLYRSILLRTEKGLQQQRWYDPGTGMTWFHRFRDGSFGYGLDRTILLSYAYLAATYEPGDELFLYGFSRGAYTARSLVGLLATVGLPSVTLLNQDLVKFTRETANLVAGKTTETPDLTDCLDQMILDSSGSVMDDAYRRYRSTQPDTESSRAAASRRRGFQGVSITFLGLWDTVGPLGIPTNALKWLNEPRYNFHDTELSPIVRRAYHALAIDEHRADHNATLWTSPARTDQLIEQRWFAGAHGDLGGTYPERGLADIPLAWMLQISRMNGLAIDRHALQGKIDALSPVHDSFGESFVGLRKWIHSRFYRPVMQTGTNTEVLDGSVHTRLLQTHSYRPKNEGLSNLLTFR